jgi:hypothetical protein
MDHVKLKIISLMEKQKKRNAIRPAADPDGPPPPRRNGLQENFAGPLHGHRIIILAAWQRAATTWGW